MVVQFWILLSACEPEFLKDLVLFFQEEQKELDEITAKRQKRGKLEDDKPGEEKTILHGNGIFLPVLIFLFTVFSCLLC